MSLITSSDLSNWYQRLNSIRNKDGIDLGNEEEEIIEENDVISISTLKHLQEKINALKDNTYLSYAEYTITNLDDIDKNTLINIKIKKNIEENFTSLESICANDLTCITTSDTTQNIVDITCATTTNSTYNNTCKTNSATANTNYSRSGSGCYTYYDDSCSDWGPPP